MMFPGGSPETGNDITQTYQTYIRVNEETKKLHYKNKLKRFCESVILQRIAAARAAIDEAQLAANQQEKSSAGDKYETSRAMGHLQKDMQAGQLAAHISELARLHVVNVAAISSLPATGSVIQCTHARFFIAAGLGKQLFEDDVIVFLSPHAPLAQTLFLKRKGDAIIFNGIANTIVDCY